MKRGFTLVELIASLVVLAIIGLIAIPIVINITDMAEKKAHKISVDAYGKAIELAISEYILDNGYKPKNISDLDIKYSGAKIECEEMVLKKGNSIYLSKCTVDGKKVKDKTNNDGYYHYGKNNVYEDKLQPAKLVKYNNVEFYVVSVSDKYATLLKKYPLTIKEVNKYGAGHINNYTSNSYEQSGGYGGIHYYWSDTCNSDPHNYSSEDCKTDYNSSDVKYVVDNWSKAKLKEKDLLKDKFGYKTRLIAYEELIDNFEFISYSSVTNEWGSSMSVNGSQNAEYEEMMKVKSQAYWTMTQYYDYPGQMWAVSSGHLVPASIQYQGALVRPVINVMLSAIEEV